MAFAETLGFEICLTLASSPEGNAMDEAFFKTFKRDCVYVNQLNHAKDVMLKINNWIKD